MSFFTIMWKSSSFLHSMYIKKRPNLQKKTNCMFVIEKYIREQKEYFETMWSACKSSQNADVLGRGVTIPKKTGDPEKKSGGAKFLQLFYIYSIFKQFFSHFCRCSYKNDVIIYKGTAFPTFFIGSKKYMFVKIIPNNYVAVYL